MGQDGLKHYIEFVYAGGSIHRVPFKQGDNPESNLPKDVCYYRYIDSHSLRDGTERTLETIYVGRIISQDEVCAEFPKAKGLIETMRDDRLPNVLLTADGCFRIIKDGMRIVDRGRFNANNL